MDGSLVEKHGVYASSCGYCQSKARTSVSYGNLHAIYFVLLTFLVMSIVLVNNQFFVLFVS